MKEPSDALNALSHAVIGAAIEVHSTLGPGFLESTYEQALAVELERRAIPFTRQTAIEIAYKGVNVGEQRVDFLVNRQLVVELKAVDALLPIHMAQLRSYLVAMQLDLGLLVNFNAVHLRTALKRVVNLK